MEKRDSLCAPGYSWPTRESKNRHLSALPYIRLYLLVLLDELKELLLFMELQLLDEEQQLPPLSPAQCSRVPIILLICQIGQGIQPPEGLAVGYLRNWQETEKHSM